MLENFFIEFTVVILLATFLGMVLQKLKQPPILAYLLTGVLLGPSVFNLITINEVFVLFSELGIVFLLFMIGLNLDLKILKEIGKNAVILGALQIVVTGLLATGLAFVLGFQGLEAAYIGIALTFSSTIVVVKLLSDQNELNSLHGKLALGILLVQDLAAILLLLLVSSTSFTSQFTEQFAFFLVKGAVLLAVFVLASKFAVNKVFDRLSRNQELLFLGGISWCLVFVSISIWLGFSKEIGAFLAGVAIASLPYNFEILGKLKPVRDLFIVLFFISLGSRLILQFTPQFFILAVVLAGFVLILKPAIVAVLMKLFHYNPHTALLTGTSLAQVSEFSLILIFLGQNLQQVSSFVSGIITLTTMITIAFSAYMIQNNRTITHHFLPLFGKTTLADYFEAENLDYCEDKYYPVVCIGFGRTGRHVFADNAFKKEEVLIVDFDPAMIQNCTKEGFHAVYGDISDPETLDRILNCQPKVIISTILDLEANSLVAQKVHSTAKNVKVIAFARYSFEAEKLYKHGVDIVIIPRILAGEKLKGILADIIQEKELNLKELRKLAIRESEDEEIKS